MRVPAVYVYIEDKSVVLPGIPQGRSGLLVVLSDRGPHNRVVEINNIRQFIRLFGKPNYPRTGPAHYLADMFLRYSQRLYVIRASLLDSNTEQNNAGIANRIIKFNDSRGSTQMIYGNFKFEKNKNYVLTDYIGYDLFTLYEYIVSETDAVSVYDAKKYAKQIINKQILEMPAVGNNPAYKEYRLILDGEYEGKSTNVLLYPTGYEKAYEYYPSYENVTYSEIVSKPNPVFIGVTDPIQVKFSPRAKLYDPDGIQLSGDEYYVLDEISGVQTNEVVFFKDIVDYNEVNVGDLVYSSVDSKYYNKRIIAKGTSIDPVSGNTLYYATLENTDMFGVETGYIGTPTPVGQWDSMLRILNPQFKFLPKLNEDKIYDPVNGTINKTYVYCKNFEAFESVNVGEWIYSRKDNETFIRQVVNKELIVDYKNTLDDPSDDVLYYYLILNEDYMGESTDELDSNGNVIPYIDGNGVLQPNGKFEFINKYNPIELEEILNLKKTPSANALYFDGYQDYGQLDSIDTDNIFYFYAIGTGSYYNKVFIKGVRNYEYEFRYLDDNSNPKFKYAFLNISTYIENNDGTITQLEGPWLVSLIETDDNNEPIIDLNTGERLYIVDVTVSYTHLTLPTKA
jgi:hypothetical protein